MNNQFEKNEEKEIKKLEGELNDEINELHRVEKKMERTLHELEELKEHEKHEKEIHLIVNGKPKPWDDEKIDYKQVVILAFGSYEDHPDVTYSILYKRGPHQNPEGSLRKGGSVFVKNQMEFNVTRAGQS